MQGHAVCRYDAPSSSYISCHNDAQSFKFADEVVVMVQTVYCKMEGYTMKPEKGRLVPLYTGDY